jgi:hypothetical protein
MEEREKEGENRKTKIKIAIEKQIKFTDMDNNLL